MSNSGRRGVVRVVVALSVVGWALCGCRTLVPYPSEFMCETNNYGQCMTVEGAYDQALGHEGKAEKSKAKTTRPPESPWRSRPSGSGKVPTSVAPAPTQKGQRTGQGHLIATALEAGLSPQELYRQAEYEKLVGLIQQPVTPLVRPAKALRTLILTYTAPDSLYMPRYIVYIADPAQFVIGDYLKPIDTRPMVYPNGLRSDAQ